MADTFDSLKSRMVVGQLVSRGIADKKVLKAMENVDRHLFVSKNLEDNAYDDCPLPIKAGQTISQPYIVAYMLEAAHINEDSKVLEIGTGSGYGAAILAEICKEVCTIEINQELADTSFPLLNSLYKNLYTKLGDGADGWVKHSPFDAIILTAAPQQMPKELIWQLKEGGRIIMPLEDEYGEQVLIRGTKNSQEKCSYEELMNVRFVPMVGKISEV
mgnify:CR=1 FL=1